MYLLRTNKPSKTLRPNASRGDKCSFHHPQHSQGGSPDEETEDSEEARRRSRQEDKDEDQNDRNSGARSSWE